MMEGRKRSGGGPLLSMALLSALFLALAVAYNLRTPYRTAGIYHAAGLPMAEDLSAVQGQTIPDIGAPDERQHVNYIRHLASGKGFPVFKIGDGEGYENHQPPLYYLLCVPVELLSGASEGFALRLFTSLIGLAVVWCVYLVGLRIAPDWRGAVCVAAVAALLPSYLALSASVSNDPLLVLWCTLGLLLCVRASRDGWTVGAALLVGGVCGLALLTKTSALVLVAFCALAALIGSPRKSALGHAAAVVVVAAVIASPWMARNSVLYGDPVGMKVFDQGFANSPKAVMFIQTEGVLGYLVSWVGWWTLRSLFGVFGYAELLLPQGIYVAGALLSAASLAGAIWAHRRSEDAGRRTAAALCWLLFALVFLGFLRFNLTYFQAQSRYLLPALAPIGSGFALGWPALCPTRLRPAAACVVIVGLLTLNVYAISLLGPAFDAIAR